jgi:putative transposase
VEFDVEENARGRICHVWFSTKRRAWVLQGDVERTATSAIWEAAARWRIQLLECGTAVNHMHLLLRLDGKESLPKAINLLKGASSRSIHRSYPELELDTGLNHFWQRGYGFTAVEPESLAARRQYMQTQRERLDKFEKIPPRCRVL